MQGTAKGLLHCSGASGMAHEPDSPCIGYCSTSLGDTVCRGCGRSAEEVDGWLLLDNEARRRVWERVNAMDTLRNRRGG